MRLAREASTHDCRRPGPAGSAGGLDEAGSAGGAGGTDRGACQVDSRGEC
jgi:hypothetical protein